MKANLISLILGFICINTFLYSQIIQDSTLILDGQINCISPTDSNHADFMSAVVGFPAGSYWLWGNGIYQITTSGQVIIDSTGRNMPGVLVMYVDALDGTDDEVWRTITPEDTIDFLVAQDRAGFFQAVLFDAEKVSDNVGKYYVNLNLIGWVGMKDPIHLSVNENKIFQNYPNPFNPKTTIKY